MNDLKLYMDDKLADITLNSQLAEKILQQTEGKCMAEEKRKGKREMPWKGAVAAALCLFLTCSVTVLAASVPSVNDWIYKWNPRFAQMLYPIQKSSEDQGIKLEILSAANDDHNIVVYFSIQDMEGKGRVDANLDLCDSEHVEGPLAFGTEIIDYDEKTSTAYYKMHGSGGKDMSNQMVTFSLSSLMSNKVTYDWYDTKIDLTTLLSQEAESLSLSQVEFQGGSAFLDPQTEIQEGYDKVLKPDAMNIPLGGDIDFVTISNIGFVDGKLHIQTKWTKSFDNHGDLWLLDEKGVVGDEAAGNAIPYNNLYFMTKEDEESQSDHTTMHWESQRYIEYIYDIGSVEELAGYNLWGWFVKDGMFTDGNWKVNFRTANVEMDSLIIRDLEGIGECVEITPFGIYIEGYGGSYDEANLTILLKDGSVLEYSHFSSDISWDGSSYDLYTAFGEEFDVKEIRSVSLDHVNIYEDD